MLSEDNVPHIYLLKYFKYILIYAFQGRYFDVFYELRTNVGFAYRAGVIDGCKCVCKKCCLSRIVEYILHLSFTTVLQIRCFDMIQLVQEYIFSAKIYLKLLVQQKYNFYIKLLNLRLFSKVQEKKTVQNPSSILPGHDCINTIPHKKLPLMYAVAMC